MSGFSGPTPQAEQCFHRYVQLTQAQLPPGFPAPRKSALRGAGIVVAAHKTLDAGLPIETSGALIQDWVGEVFLPSTTITQVRAVMQAYPDYKTLFAPDVIDSKLLSRDGDRFQVSLRLLKKQILTVVLDAAYDIHYAAPAPNLLTIDSRSTHIAEADGADRGFLWNLNSYWLFEQADGGVYARCQAVSLSRDVPFGLFVIRKFVERFPQQALTNTLDCLRRAVIPRSARSQMCDHGTNETIAGTARLLLLAARRYS